MVDFVLDPGSWLWLGLSALLNGQMMRDHPSSTYGPRGRRGGGDPKAYAEREVA